MTPPAFIIGAYSQPLASFAKWKGRGINTLVHSELQNGTVKQSDWRNAARAASLCYFDTFMGEADALDPYLLGWILRDSDEWNRARGNPPFRPPVAPFIAEAQKLAAINKAAGTNKLIFANADGPSITTALFEKPPYDGVKNNEKALLPNITARSMDWYPVVGTAKDTPEEIARRPMYLPAQGIHRLRTWAAGMPEAKYFAIIEAAKNWKAPFGVTPAQMREQVEYLTGGKRFPFPSPNGAMVESVSMVPADGIIWWTANGRDGPAWDWDVMTPDQAAAMIAINKALSPAPPIPQPDPTPTLEQQVAALAGQVAGAVEVANRASAEALAANGKADAAMLTAEQAGKRADAAVDTLAKLKAALP